VTPSQEKDRYRYTFCFCRWFRKTNMETWWFWYQHVR